VSVNERIAGNGQRLILATGPSVAESVATPGARGSGRRTARLAALQSPSLLDTATALPHVPGSPRLGVLRRRRPVRTGQRSAANGFAQFIAVRSAENECLRVLRALFPEGPRLRAMFVQFRGGLNGCGTSPAGLGGSQPGRREPGQEPCVPAPGPPGVAEQSVVRQEQASARLVWQNVLLGRAAALERPYGPRIGQLPPGICDGDLMAQPGADRPADMQARFAESLRASSPCRSSAARHLLAVRQHYC
jgi:hypothetical protein